MLGSLPVAVCQFKLQTDASSAVWNCGRQTDDVHVLLTAVNKVIRQTDNVHVLLTAVNKVIRHTMCMYY